MNRAVKLARDTWLTLQYEAGLLLRDPIAIATSLFSPVAYLLFFTPLLKSTLGASSYRAAFQIYVPSLLCLTGLFGGLFAGFALLAAMRQGVIGRLQVTPPSRSGLLLGRELTLVLTVGIQSVLITLLALVFGLRVRPANFVLALIVLAMMVLLGVSIAYALALAVPNESVLPTLMNGLAQPLSLLAGGLIPLSVAPLWVRDVALWNPFAWAANGMRALFLGHIGATVVWEAGAILAGLAMVAVVLSARLFSREVAWRSWPGSPWWPWCCRPGCSAARSHDRAARVATEPKPGATAIARARPVVLRSIWVRVRQHARHGQEADR